MIVFTVHGNTGEDETGTVLGVFTTEELARKSIFLSHTAEQLQYCDDETVYGFNVPQANGGTLHCSYIIAGHEVRDQEFKMVNCSS